MTATRTILSPNHYGGWSKGPPRAVVIHSTRSTVSSKTDAQELQSTINWFTSVNSQASAHWVVSEIERVRMVEDKYPAWHAVEHSWEAYGIEITQPTIDRPFKEGHYQNLVMVCLPYVRAGIPIVHLSTLAYGDSRRGFVGHDETAQGLRDGKSDPGPQFNWSKFMTMLAVIPKEEDMSKLIRCLDGGKVYAVGSCGKRYIDDQVELGIYIRLFGVPMDVYQAEADKIPDCPTSGSSGTALTPGQAKEAAKQAAREGTG